MGDPSSLSGRARTLMRAGGTFGVSPVSVTTRPATDHPIDVISVMLSMSTPSIVIGAAAASCTPTPPTSVLFCTCSL